MAKNKDKYTFTSTLRTNLLLRYYADWMSSEEILQKTFPPGEEDFFTHKIT